RRADYAEHEPVRKFGQSDRRPGRRPDGRALVCQRPHCRSPRRGNPRSARQGDVSAPASVDVEGISGLAPPRCGNGGFPRLTRELAPVPRSNTERKPMPRLRYIEGSGQTPHTRELIESARRTGAPDPRVVSLMTRSRLGIAWVEYWNKLLYQGTLPHRLKEMCRIKISVAHQCGYCSTVRSTVAKAEGLTEDMINDLFDYAGSKRFSEREKAALHYADLFKQGEHSIA